MTFALVAREEATGAFGMVVASSSVAVAARCIHLRAGVGAVASQNITDPGLGERALDLLARGIPAAQAIEELRSTETDIEYRQLVVLDSGGRTGVFSGAHTLGEYAGASGSAAAAAGNLLASSTVPAAMLGSWTEAAGQLFERRLLLALRAGLLAGGEVDEVRSAGLAVVAEVSWRVTDLRVDDDPDPITELGRLVELWLPQKQAYLTRAMDPAEAPSYGVQGEVSKDRL